MLRKKLYLIIALLAYTPILLGSDKNPHDLSEKHILVGVQLKDQEQPECVFASEYVTGNQIYQALQKTKHYAGRVKQLILYTKNGNRVIWEKENNHKPFSSRKLSELSHNQGLVIKPEYILGDIATAYSLWYKGKNAETPNLEEEKARLDARKEQFLNLSSSHKRFLIVNKSEEKEISKLLTADKGKILFPLYIQILGREGMRFQIKSISPSLTVDQLKKKLQPIVGHEPEKQRVIWRGSELKDDKETLMERDISSGATVYLAFRSSQNSPVQRKNPNSMLLPALGIAALVVGAGLVLYLLVKKAQKKDSKILDSVHNKRS